MGGAEMESVQSREGNEIDGSIYRGDREYVKT